MFSPGQDCATSMRVHRTSQSSLYYVCNALTQLNLNRFPHRYELHT